MGEYRQYAVVAVVVVAVLSLGVGEAVRWSYRSGVGGDPSFDAAACEDTSVSAWEIRRPDESEAAVPYEELTPAHRRAFERALDRSNNTAAIPPASLPALPGSNESHLDSRHVVSYDGARYRLSVNAWNCYSGGVGPPAWLRPALVPFLLIDRLLRQFWGLLAVVVGLAVGWRVLTDWLRFGP